MESSADQNPTRISLLLRLRNPENLEAWREFVEIYRPLIFRLALAQGLQPADCEDISQEVLARVVRKVDSVDLADPELSFRGWLAVITRNLTIDFFRKSGRSNSLDSSIAKQIPKFDENTFEATHQKQLIEWASNKIKKNFRPRTWQAFWRTAVDGIAVEKVSEELEMSVGQVYVNKSRVMSLLKQTIEESKFDSNSSWRINRE